MSQFKQLNSQDVLFVGAEKWNIYQHTGGVLILDPSTTPDFGFEKLKRHIEERLLKIPRFRWKLHEVSFGLDLPYWVEDPDFNIDNHVKRIAVPSPGDRQVLGELAAFLYSKHLDRTRPLWEIWLIEGLADGQCAVLTKMHHCMMDGEAAMKVGEVLSQSSPDAPLPQLDSAIFNEKPGDVPEFWQSSFKAVRQLSSLPLRVGSELFSVARGQFSQLVANSGKKTKKPKAPSTPLNADIGSGRGLVFASLPMAAIKAVKTHFGVTVNDVVLALVGTTMRTYLQQMDELPETSLRTFIAVSLRKDSDEAFGNKVTSVDVSLATDTDDLEQRLRVIARDTAAAKETAHSGHNTGFMEIISLLPPFLVGAVATAIPPQQTPQIIGANFLVSNVRGSPVPMYYAGAKMIATYPIAIITPGGGINFTCTSGADNLDVGITYAPDLVPLPWSIADGLQTALDGYLEPLKGKRHRRKSVSSRARTAKRSPRQKKA